jgi:glycosyltransferase involved in cell wall biosynthesis
MSPNIIPVEISPPAKHPLLWKYWYDVKIRRILNKYNSDVFVSFDRLCSLTTKVPQCLVVNDLTFLDYPSGIQKSHLLYYKRNISKFLRKAKTIATVSEFSRQHIINNYKIEKDKVKVIYSAAREIFEPISPDVAISTKNKCTSSTEYFLYAGGIHPGKNLMNLLKAFSIFKKRQKSNLKLVLAGRLVRKYDSFIQNLKNYKYRDDVILLVGLNEDDLAKIMASAYALVNPSMLQGFDAIILDAMRCNVPVITLANSPMEEIANGAALYADAKSFEDLADKMMRIYKDENLRKELIEKGKLISQEYSWKRTAELLWQTILQTVG